MRPIPPHPMIATPTRSFAAARPVCAPAATADSAALRNKSLRFTARFYRASRRTGAALHYPGTEVLTSADFEIGQTIGDYEIVDRLGRGGMGAVYRVRNVISQRLDAMKVLLPDLESTPDLGERFLREIRVHASLRHPNIAQLLTAFRIENRLLMFMELVEGFDVAAVERRQADALKAAGMVDEAAG